MTSQEKLKLIGNAYTVKKVDDSRERLYVHNEAQPAEFQEAIKKIQFKLNDETQAFELDYEIMNDACNILSGLTLEEIKTLDVYEASHDSANVYTSTRLSYLNINNQEEISEILKEYGADISDACAIWYEHKVSSALELLKDFILE